MPFVRRSKLSLLMMPGQAVANKPQALNYWGGVRRGSQVSRHQLQQLVPYQILPWKTLTAHSRRCAAAPPGQDLERSEAVSAAERLYSSLDPQTLAHQPGSVFGAAALVAGTTVGAGILALPYTTQVRPPIMPAQYAMTCTGPHAVVLDARAQVDVHAAAGLAEVLSPDPRLSSFSACLQGAGFVPSSTGMVGAAVYMIISGLLVAEVSINTMCALGTPQCSRTP